MLLSRALLSLTAVAVFVAACTPEPTAGKKKKKGGGGDDDDDTDPSAQGPDTIGDGSSTPPLNTKPSIETKVPATGTLELNLTADKGAASNAIVSLGVPFPQGVFTDAKKITVLDKAGKPVAIHTKSLATWPGDNSIRSVLVAFKATLANGASEKWKIKYGTAPEGTDAGELAPNPAGPVMAVLSPDHYAVSLVSGPLLPRAKNKKFAQYETEVDRGDEQINIKSVPWDSTGGDQGDGTCNGTANHRTYYDGIHARYQLALRAGDAKRMRDAHEEMLWYRQNEVEWFNDKLAITKCEEAERKKAGAEGPWTPDGAPLDWSTLRMMSGQGSLDDYLLTGDPESKKLLAGFGEAYMANYDVLDQGTLRFTERNLGWTIMGIVSYYAINHEPRVKEAAERAVGNAYDWQNAGTSGALEHDINRPDPGECNGAVVGETDPTAGPKGASPFMTSLVVDGIMDWWLMTNDPKTVTFMTKMATWYKTKAIATMPADQGSAKAFRYLWGCLSTSYDPSTGGDPDGATSPELNILINHVFGGAWAVTKDKAWIDFGDQMATDAIEYIFVGTPKAWNQQTRSFGKYLGYRALAGATL